MKQKILTSIFTISTILAIPGFSYAQDNSGQNILNQKIIALSKDKKIFDALDKNQKKIKTTKLKKTQKLWQKQIKSGKGDLLSMMLENPTSTYLKQQSKNDPIVGLRIYNVQGRLIASTAANGKYYLASTKKGAKLLAKPQDMQRSKLRKTKSYPTRTLVNQTIVNQKQTLGLLQAEVL